ncbi:hypothetical protein [Methanococcoides sp. AM1]|uniref:hypothetical protein n=1 Tax=Methanococcoides sp. AM1 TaxID=1201011 RepID=UPI001083FEDF|nr:hypothetical protein [Methanococcoides sp. AM1]
MIIATLFSVPASADLSSELDFVITEFNLNADSAPAPLKGLLGNEDILAVIDMNDGSTLALKIVTKDMIVTDFSAVDPDGSDLSPSIIINTNEKTVRELLGSDDPVNDFLEAYDGGNVKIEAVSIVNKVTLSVGNVILKLSQLLGLV